MSAKKGGLNLGKGLQSLIPNDNINKKKDTVENEIPAEDITVSAAKSVEKKKAVEKTRISPVKADIPSDMQIFEVRTSLVIPNSDQPRKNFDEASIAELADSIKLYGVVQPLIVQKKGRYYEIISGERRWRASKIAGLKKIPVIIREYSSQEVMEVSLIENIQREDLNPVEEAAAYKRLIDEFGLTQADIAKRVSKSRTAITNSMRLLKLDERIQQMIIDDLISAGHARALLGMEDMEAQYDAAMHIVADGLSVRETEKLIQKMKRPPKEKPVFDEQIAAIYSSIEEQLKQIIGSKVTIKQKKSGKGSFEIEYYSQEEFDRILDLMHTIKEVSST